MKSVAFSTWSCCCNLCDTLILRLWRKPWRLGSSLESVESLLRQVSGISRQFFDEIFLQQGISRLEAIITLWDYDGPPLFFWTIFVRSCQSLIQLLAGGATDNVAVAVHMLLLLDLLYICCCWCLGCLGSCTYAADAWTRLPVARIHFWFCPQSVHELRNCWYRLWESERALRNWFHFSPAKHG